jgi:hypothetical protein
MSKTLQEKLDAVALELEPILWELLNETCPHCGLDTTA